MASYARGQAVRFSVEVRDLVGALADPAELKWRALPPPTALQISALYTQGQVVRESTGRYHYDYAIADSPASEGRWTYRWITTGPVVAGTTDQAFNVEPSVVL